MNLFEIGIYRGEIIMQKFEYYIPTKVVFGEETENRAGELCKDFGASRVLIVYGGQSAIKSGLIDRVEKSIKASNLECEKVGGVVPNPLLSKARQIIKLAIDFKADFILAVGGGSVIDTAKAVAHGVANPETDIWDYFCGKGKVTKSLKHGCVLTISAAGSEMSNSCVLTNDELSEPTKRGFNTEFNRCQFAIMNPVLTYTLPTYQIAAGVADIFMHTSERFFAKIQGNHLSDEIACGLFRDIIKYGYIGVQNPTDYEAMSEIMWCGSISHNGLTGIGSKGDTARDGDWACHQLGMAESALYNYTHGATLTSIWSSWAEYVRSDNMDRFVQFGRQVYGINEGTELQVALMAIRRTKWFFESIGMPTSLTEIMGRTPTDEELLALADNCSYGGTRTIGSMKVLDKQDMYNIYKAAV